MKNNFQSGEDGIRARPLCSAPWQQCATADGVQRRARSLRWTAYDCCQRSTARNAWPRTITPPVILGIRGPQLAESSGSSRCVPPEHACECRRRKGAEQNQRRGRKAHPQHKTCHREHADRPVLRAIKHGTHCQHQVGHGHSGNSGWQNIKRVPMVRGLRRTEYEPRCHGRHKPWDRHRPKAIDSGTDHE